MRVLKLAALVGAIMAGSLGLSNGGASASAAMPIASTDSSLISKAIHQGRAEYAQYRYRRVYYRRPFYRGVRVYRPYRVVVVRRRPFYRPVYGVYRPFPRVVCRTRIRVVRTAFGGFVRRPVRVCWRRW